MKIKFVIFANLDYFSYLTCVRTIIFGNYLYNSKNFCTFVGELNTSSWRSPAQNTYTQRDCGSAPHRVSSIEDPASTKLLKQYTGGGIPPETEHRCANQTTRRVICEH